MDDREAALAAILEEAAAEEATRLDLSGLDLEALPPAVARLEQLTHLTLRGNRLRELPSDLGCLVRLEQLSLADNQIERLPAAIGQFTHLTHLNLKNNRLQTLPAELFSLTNLVNLHLAGNPLPLPPGILGRWDRPQEILAYYREHCLARPAPPPPNLVDLLTRYFDEEELAWLTGDLAVPLEVIPAADHRKAAAAFLEYHFTHGLEVELRDLLQALVPHIDWTGAVLPAVADGTDPAPAPLSRSDP